MLRIVRCRHLDSRGCVRLFVANVSVDPFRFCVDLFLLTNHERSSVRERLRAVVLSLLGKKHRHVYIPSPLMMKKAHTLPHNSESSYAVYAHHFISEREELRKVHS